MVQDSKLFPIARRLSPELSEFEGNNLVGGFIETLLALWTTPFAAISLIWLAAITDLTVIRDNLMALSRTLIRTYAMENGERPDLALAQANERILADTESDQFVTVFYGILDQESGRLTYANAGHNPGYLVQRNENGQKMAQTSALMRTGIPLGMFPDMVWEKG